MSNSKTDRVQGELLRGWRESRNMAISELASLANLSAAQVQQLESGGSHLFYTGAIKESAARKVAALLGGDPSAVIRPGPVEDPGPDASVVDELIELSRKKATSERFGSVFSMPLRWVAWGAAGLVLALLLATSWAWYRKTQDIKAVPSRGPLASAEAMPTSHPMPASPVRLTEPAGQADVTAASRWAGSQSSAEGASSAARVVVAETGPVPPLESAAAAKVQRTGLCQQGLPDAGRVAAQASKVKGVVYVVAQKEGTVCVVDGAGQQTVLSLKVNEAKSVYGPSPWRVHFEQSEQVQLYFQGMRVRFPDTQTTAVVMHEGERNP